MRTNVNPLQSQRCVDPCVCEGESAWALIHKSSLTQGICFLIPFLVVFVLVLQPFDCVLWRYEARTNEWWLRSSQRVMCPSRESWQFIYGFLATIVWGLGSVGMHQVKSRNRFVLTLIRAPPCICHRPEINFDAALTLGAIWWHEVPEIALHKRIRSLFRELRSKYNDRHSQK